MTGVMSEGTHSSKQGVPERAGSRRGGSEGSTTEQRGSHAVVKLPAHKLNAGPVPKHIQLRELLEDLCQNKFSPGDMLPGERVIEHTYGVSRITVRRAIGDLVASGWLTRTRGKGTFVSAHPLVSRMHLASFSSEMRAQNVEASSKILQSGRGTAPEEVAHFFGVTPDTSEIHLKRLRLGDQRPYAIDDSWYNAEYVPGLLENDIYNSVYSILDEVYKVPITNAEQRVTAVAANPTTAALLDVEVGIPLLNVVRFSLSHGTPIEVCNSLYRTDRYHLTAQVVRAPSD